LIYPQEKHFATMRQLTNGGDNAEAYWSFDDTRLVFQATRDEWMASCDQIFLYDLMKENGMDAKPPMLSTGEGRTTCSYFMPGNKEILYASTHHHGSACPPVPERRSDGLYVWPVYADYDIFVADLRGEVQRQLTNEPGYDAEATISPKGDRIVFTSMRSGDLELYTMDMTGKNVRQITNTLGYDGGAFFSPDGKQLVFRASRPTTAEEVNTYKSLLAEGLVQPTKMELFVCNADGTNMRQVTQLGNANWAPFFHPSGNKIIFSSNHTSTRGFPFNLYMVNVDGSGLEQVTFDQTFDSFPMFSYNGKYLAFASNRNNGGTRATNLFVAEWKD
jgi:Tol biopolymer transport system component